MRPANLTGTYSDKTLAILAVCALPLTERQASWTALEERFARRAVAVKMRELIARGYVQPTICPSQATLTEKGHRVVETHGTR